METHQLVNKQCKGAIFSSLKKIHFIPSLFISGATNLASKGAMKQERLGQARWNIANNPEKYKQLVANKVQAGKLTKEEGLKQTAAVDNLSKRLDSMTDMKNIKNLTNLLDDKELQFQYSFRCEIWR